MANKLLEMSTPKYRALVTVSRTWPWSLTTDSKTPSPASSETNVIRTLIVCQELAVMLSCSAPSMVRYNAVSSTKRGTCNETIWEVNNVNKEQNHKTEPCPGYTDSFKGLILSTALEKYKSVSG